MIFTQILFLKHSEHNFTFHYVDMSVETFFAFACLMNKTVCWKKKKLALV